MASVPTESPAAAAGRSLPRSNTASTRRPTFPLYDRSLLRPAVVHIGVGGFHRAHQAVYFDELAQRGISHDWGIVGVSLRRPVVKEILDAQDCLFTVVERGGIRERARVVGALTRMLCAPQDPQAVLGALSSEATRLVTLTVTGDGYGVDRATGRFDPDHPEVADQLAQPGRPSTAYAFIAEALRRRRALGRAPFTVLSCDNLPDNGSAARAAVVGYARCSDAGLAAWIDRHVAFPSCVVDRITPGATDEDCARLERGFGLKDRAPVVTEPFSQWIIEDSFCNERPPLDAVGASFVADVAPYKLVKTRMLNGAHTAIGPLGVLAGHRTIDAALADPVFERFVGDLLGQEITPLLSEPDGISLDDYQATLLRRFSNPAVGDRLARLSERGSTKIPSYLLPSLRDALEQDGRHSLLLLSVAGWLRFYRGVDSQGTPFEIRDAMADVLQEQAKGEDPVALLGQRAIFGDLAERPDVVAGVRAALADLDRYGARGALAAHVTAGRMAAAA